MSFIWLISVPVALYLFRKFRVYKWGQYNEQKTLKDKVFVVTGGSSGLGKETVKELASREATVIMACRDLQKAKTVVAEIRSKIKGGELIPMELDLASFDSIRHFSKEVKEKFSQINVLINNAGVSIPRAADQNLKTEDGHEINFGTNHLGHFLLTNLLMEKLEQSTPSRVVIVSSKLHESGTIDFNNLQGERGFPPGLRNPAYNNSKLANIYFCRELSKKLSNGVETYALCPGFCYTSLFRHSKFKWYQYLLFAPVAFIFMKSANQGCQTILYCALSDDVTGKSGKVFRDCKLYESAYKFDDNVQNKLWVISENLTKLKEFKLI
uniref:Putative dehydrogenase with different specificities related to short-chain alcohol dehydrogenase n=1 Tax=Triatoma dimidiata TaxID=72491 RepID=A0A0V0GBR5_TRIDM